MSCHVIIYMRKLRDSEFTVTSRLLSKFHTMLRTLS